MRYGLLPKMFSDSVKPRESATYIYFRVGEAVLRKTALKTQFDNKVLLPYRSSLTRAGMLPFGSV